MDSRKKKLTQYVVPTILGNCAYFLFTIIDGIFVGQGVGTDALGAVNLVWPFVMVLNAIIMLTVVGGVTVSAVRIGRGDIAGANQAFMHSLAGTLTAAIIMTLIGTCLRSQRCSAQTRPIIGSCATICSGIRFSRCRRG